MFSSSPVKASVIIGAKVVNPKGDSLGDIKEVVIDPRTGKVAYAVVSFGGFLSMGAKLVAIPFSALEYDVTKNDYVLDVSKERLKAARGFDPGHWPSMADKKWNREVYKYYDSALSPVSQRKPVGEEVKQRLLSSCVPEQESPGRTGAVLLLSSPRWH